ncbi:MAG TPA: monofunctional biosynthetic peptidoglycan transglycosylase [Burkholderiaceae bacterium]|nr:monofunctional biosynthetic peptidoglycan transglycosylase [Burkholderiaceae bacterium]
MRKTRFAIVLLLFAAFSTLLYQFGLFVMVLWLNFSNPSSSAFMDAARSRLKAQGADTTIIYEWVPYPDISTHLKRAVIASEDANFVSHHGVEWDAIRQAWEYNRRQASKGTNKRRGGSTITQQLAKNLFLSGSRSYLRKVQELILTYMIELVMPKERILELYLNVAQWGTNVFGAQGAARHYYQTSAGQLGPAQAARLATMLPNPIFYDQNRNTRWLQSRSATIQQRMQLVTVP